MNRELLEIASLCQNLSYAVMHLDQSIGSLDEIENTDETLEYLTETVLKLEKIGQAMAERAEKMMSDDTRCAGCPGTEGGCCR